MAGFRTVLAHSEEVYGVRNGKQEVHRHDTSRHKQTSNLKVTRIRCTCLRFENAHSTQSMDNHGEDPPAEIIFLRSIVVLINGRVSYNLYGALHKWTWIYMG
jgi:hypothetical protein